VHGAALGSGAERRKEGVDPGFECLQWVARGVDHVEGRLAAEPRRLAARELDVPLRVGRDRRFERALAVEVRPALAVADRAQGRE